MRVYLLSFGLITSVVCYFYCEFVLILNIAEFDVDNDIRSLVPISALRLISSLAVVTLMAVLSTNLAHDRRIITMHNKWLRDEKVSDLLPSYMLTVFEQLIAFYYLARLRILIDIIFVVLFIGLLIKYLDFHKLIMMAISGIVVLLAGVILYYLFSIISHKTTKTENDLVECAKLINQRGSHGWNYEDVKNLILNFSNLSLKLNKYLSIRYSISGALRVAVEFAVFILVALGILITKSNTSAEASEPEIILLLIFSRLAPILFSIFSQASTLGFGDSAKNIYFTGSRKGD